MLKNIGTSQSTYSEFSQAVIKAVNKVLPMKKKANPGWFEREEFRLLPLIEARNEAMRGVFRKRARQSTMKLKAIRKKLRISRR